MGIGHCEMERWAIGICMGEGKAHLNNERQPLPGSFFYSFLLFILYIVYRKKRGGDIDMGWDEDEDGDIEQYN